MPVLKTGEAGNLDLAERSPEEVVSEPLMSRTLGVPVAESPVVLTSDVLGMPLATENTLPAPMLRLPWM